MPEKEQELNLPHPNNFKEVLEQVEVQALNFAHRLVKDGKVRQE